MTLLRELQRDATDPNVDITTLLRKARVLAARLNNAEFESWIKHELNEYPYESDLPEYRVLSVVAKAHLFFGYSAPECSGHGEPNTGAASDVGNNTLSSGLS